MQINVRNSNQFNYNSTAKKGLTINYKADEETSVVTEDFAKDGEISSKVTTHVKRGVERSEKERSKADNSLSLFYVSASVMACLLCMVVGFFLSPFVKDYIFVLGG